MIALNVFINYGADLGWTNIKSIVFLAVTIIGLIVFINFEKGKELF